VSIAAGPRASAIAAADATCPRCGSLRASDDRYCLECGFRLPRVDGRIASLRRRWIRRLGWYPGDWIWPSLLALVVAAGGAAAAIAVSERRATGPAGPPFEVATTAAAVREPTPVPLTTAPRVTRRKLPTPPEPTRKAAGPANGRLVWPARENGWTVVLVSYPKTDRVAALDKSSQAARAGLDQVGVLDSSKFASLQPGYFVVFAGIYGSKSDADAALATARGAGFGGAYSRQIAR
jgi:hypothetical protein